jgi:hypothetical protein
MYTVKGTVVQREAQQEIVKETTPKLTAATASKPVNLFAVVA